MLWCCWLGGRKGIRPVKNWVVRCWHGYLSGASCRLAYAQLMPMPLTVSCFSKIQTGFTFLVPAHPGSPGKRAVKWVCYLLTKNTHHYTGNFPAGFASNQTSFSCFGLAQERECGTACCYNSGLSSRSSQILQAVQTCKKQICHSIWPISQPRREARSRWPARLVTYRDGIPTQTRSPIPVRTVTDVGWLHSCDKWRHRYAKPSPVVSTGNKAEWVKVLSHSKHAVLGPLALILLQIYCRSIDGRILKISQQLAMLKVKSGQLIQTTTLDFCSRSPL